MSRWLRTIFKWVALAAILALAAYLRLSHLDLIEFRGDQAELLELARDLVEGIHLPLVGPFYSIGVLSSPLMVYLMALPQALSPDPRLAAAVVGLGGVLAVFFCYRLTRRYFGWRAGLLAALLFASGFWATFVSRELWDASLQPLLALLFYSALLSVVVDGKPGGAAWALLWLSLLIQAHLTSLPHVIVFGLTLLLFFSRFRWRYLGLGLAAALLSHAPYLYWELSNGFANTKALLDQASQSARFSLAPFDYTTHLISSHAYNAFFGTPTGEALTPPAGLSLLRDALLILFIYGLLYLAVAWIRHRGRLRSPQAAPYLLLLLWFLVPILFHLRQTGPSQAHHFLSLLPMIYVTIAVSSLESLGRLRRWLAGRSLLRSALTGLFLIFFLLAAGSQIYVFETFNTWIERDATLPGYGLPLKHQREAIERADELSSSLGEAEVHIFTHEDYLQNSLSYLARGRFPGEIFNEGMELLLPFQRQKATVYLSTSDRTPAAAFIARYLGAHQAATIAHPGGGDAFRIYSLPPQASLSIESDELGLKELSWGLENGVQLRGYRLPPRVSAGSELEVLLYWEVGAEGVPPQGDYVFFFHLRDSRGRSWTGQDSISHRSARWRVGDQVLSWRRLPIPAEAPRGGYWLEVGMYDRWNRRRVSLLNPPQGEVEDSIRLGPIKVVPAVPLPKPSIEHPLGLGLGGKITLLGYDLEPERPKPGQALALKLYWRCETPLTKDYTVFVHLLDERGRRVAQQDSQPLKGGYPTSMWEVGEVIEDEHELGIPETAQPGRYHLEVGMYLLASGERLELTKGEGDFVRLKLEVAAPSLTAGAKSSSGLPE